MVAAAATCPPTEPLALLPDPWAGLLDAVEAGQTVSVSYTNALDLASKRGAIARRAGRRGFRVEMRHSDGRLAVRRKPGAMARRRSPELTPDARAWAAAQPPALPRGPDTLTRVAEQMAREMQRERSRRARVRLRSVAGSIMPLEAQAEPLLVCYVLEDARRCGACGQPGNLHYSAVRSLANHHHQTGSERVLLCPSCLSLVPHRLLF